MRVTMIGAKLNSNQELNTQRNESSPKSKDLSFKGQLGEFLIHTQALSTPHITAPPLQIWAYVLLALLAIAACKNRN